MMTNREFCRHIERNGTNYGIYLEKNTNRVWVDKSGNSTFGQENFGNLTAKNPLDALEVARQCSKNLENNLNIRTMKNLLFLILLLTFSASVSQGQTLNETVEYINNNLRPVPVKSDVEIKKDGTILYHEYPKSPDKVYYKGNLKNMTIKEVQKRETEMEVGDYKIIIECKTTNCIDYFWTYEGLEKHKTDTNIIIYFIDKETAMKVRKAFLHAQSLTMQYKDPFDK